MIIDKKYGKSFSKLRKSRKLSQKDVVGKSHSTLSTFETGDTEPGFIKIFEWLEMMNVSLSEYRITVNNYELNGFDKLDTDLNNAYNENNVEELKKILQREQNKANKEVNHELTCIRIKSMISVFDEKIVLSEDEKEKVTDHLEMLDQWGYYELKLFAATINAFETKRLTSLALKVILRSEFYKIIPYNRRITAVVLINIMITLIERDEFQTARTLEQQIEEILREEDMFERVVFLFVRGGLDFSEGKLEEGKKKMQDAIWIFETLECDEFARAYQENYDNAISSLVQ